MAGKGPAPKPADKRRNTRVPASWGAATPTEGPAASAPPRGRALDIDDPHEMVSRMWDVVQTSAEAAFYSEADWARLAMELWHADHVLKNPKGISPTAWQAVQHGLTEMLISPAAKRRGAIALKPVGPDPDREAAVVTMARYRQMVDHPTSPTS